MTVAAICEVRAKRQIYRFRQRPGLLKRPGLFVLPCRRYSAIVVNQQMLNTVVVSTALDKVSVRTA